jgi:hypothetical protein
MSDCNVGGQGIEILPHDEGSFLVQSRTKRDEHHMVEFLYKWAKDPTTGEKIKEYTGEITCTCPSFHFRKECFHTKYIKSWALKRLIQQTTNQ